MIMAEKVANCKKAGGAKTTTEWLAQVEPRFNQLAHDLHELILQTVPDFEQAIKWGRPAYLVGKQVRCYIAEFPNYLHLGFFNGAFITNADNIIEGTGKNLRHIKLTKLSPQLKKRLAQAITESYNLPPEANSR